MKLSEVVSYKYFTETQKIVLLSKNLLILSAFKNFQNNDRIKQMNDILMERGCNYQNIM